MNTMGKVATLLLIAVMAAASLQAQSRKKRNVGKKIREPFSDVRSDKENWRVVANAESPRNDIAKMRSETAAKAKLAGLINTIVKQVTDSYVEQLQVGNKTEVLEKFQAMTRTVVNQTLVGITLKDQQCYEKKGPDGEYIQNCYSVIEMNKKEFTDAQDKAISKDDKLRLSFDRAKYEATFDKEMEKLDKTETARVEAEGGE